MKKSSSLKKVLTINYILIATLPVILISVINIYFVSQHLQTNIRQQNTTIAVARGEQIDVFLQRALDALDAVHDLNTPALNQSEVTNILTTMVKNFQDFESIQILDQDGEIINLAPYKAGLIGINLSGQDFYHLTKAGNLPYWSDTFISMETGQPTLTLSLPLDQGMIVGHLNLAKLNDLSKQSIYGGKSLTVVTDKKGIYIAHPKREYVFQRVRDPLIAGSQSTIETGRTYPVNYLGKEMLAGVAYVRQTGWPVIIYQDMDAAYLPVRQLRNTSMVVGLLALIITLLLVMRNLNKIIGAINRLSHRTKELAAGIYVFPRDQGYLELNEFSAHFQAMAKTIKLREFELQKKNRQLAFIGYHDGLTSLYNRTFFQEELERLGSSQQSIGMIVMDLDGLKLINDAFGHAMGDKILADAARIFDRCTPAEGIIARIGGDEFAIILTMVNEENLEVLCRCIGSAVSEYNLTAKNGSFISVSMGYALQKDGDINLELLLKEADEKMYRAKLHQEHSIHGSAIQALFQTLEARDYITEGHCERMEALVAAMGHRQGLATSRVYDLRLLARFHDIGKIGVPDRILFKPGPLDRDEIKEMQRHSEIGFRIARSSYELKPIADLILKNHERWDGAGYPFQLKGRDIPLECRIMAIVDAYDAMTNDRPYRLAMSKDAALAELRRCAGNQFDPDLVAVFLDLIDLDEAVGADLQMAQK